jgi:intein/homing endonuclease
MSAEKKEDNNFLGTLKKVANYFTASYKPPVGEQIKQAERGEAWWRDFAWEEYACVVEYTRHDPNSVTEILTKTGWKPIAEVKVGEEVATLLPDNYIEYQSVISIFKKPYKGKGVHIKSSKVDILVTPNHKQVIRATHWRKYKLKRKSALREPLPNDVDFNSWSTEDGFKFIYAGDLVDKRTVYEIKKDAKWRGTDAQIININGTTYPIEPFLRFLGYYLSEGSVNDANQSGIYNVIRLTQSNSSLHHISVKQKMFDTFKALGFNPSIDNREVRIYNPNLATWLHTLGTHAWEKKVPSFIFNLSSDKIRTFLEAYIEGDGYQHKNKSATPIIYTTSPFIRDAIQELALKAGWCADWTTRKGGFSDRTQYVITIIKKQTTPEISGRFDNVTIEDCDGYAVCVSVPKYHTLYIRRNGKAVWTGNTKYLPGIGLGFSIHPDRTTIVKDDKGIHIYTFQELWDIYSEKFPIKQDVVEVENIRKPIEYIEIPRMRLFTLSYNRQRKEADWQEVRSIIRHQYKGKLVHLNQTIGETIVTPNHSVYDENGNVVSAQSNPNLLYIRKIPTSVTITDSFTLPYPVHKRKESGKYGRVYVAKNLVKRQMNRDELLAFSRFLGAYVAEGCYWFYDGGRKGLVHISNNNIQWLESLGRDTEKFMERVKWRIDKQSTNPQSGKSTYCLSIRSNDLASVLALMIGKGAENKRVPEFLFEADKIFREAFLINYTVGDGETLGKYSITNEGAILQYGVVFNGITRSIKLASGLAVLLAMDGKDFSVKSYIDHHGKRMYSIKEVSHHSFRKNSKKITYIDYEGFLFDISVRGDFTDNTQNFIDAMGLIVAHQTVYPYTAVWEKIWGAVPAEDYAKYKQLYVQEPFIRATIDLHVFMAVTQGYELDYPVDTVINDVKAFLDRHDFLNLLKILVREALIFGNSYAEIVRTWFCPQLGHDLEALRISYEEKFADGKGYWWCFPKGTIILGDNKSIEDYHTNDKVVGINGLQTVVRTFTRPYKGDMVTIKGSGLLEFTGTATHKVLAIQSITDKRTHQIIGFTEPTKIHLQDLIPKRESKDGHYLVMPRLKGDIDIKEITLEDGKVFPLNEKTVWLLGAYVAEGSYRDKYSIQFSLNKNENEFAEQISNAIKELGHTASIYDRKDRNEKRVVLSSVIYAKYFPIWCGKDSLTKQIPDFILYNKDLSLLQAFLKGYEKGDGCILNKNNGKTKRQVNVTVSLTLAQQLQLAYARLGIFATVEKKTYQYPFYNKEKDKTYYAHQKYEVSYSINGNPKKRHAFINDENIYVPVRKKIISQYNGTVYNLEVTPTHTYLVSNVVVSNCDRMDVAAKHNELYPDHKLENPYGEITRIKPLDPCLAPGTNILLRNDVKPVETVNIGELAITHTGQYKPVAELHKRQLQEDNEIVAFKISKFSEPFKVTLHHPILAIPKMEWNNYLNRLKNQRKEEKRYFAGLRKTFPHHNIKPPNSRWIEAGDLQIGDVTLYALNKNIGMGTLTVLDVSKYVSPLKRNSKNYHDISSLKISIDDEFGELIGWYLSEGSTNNDGIQFSLSVDEQDVAKKLLDIIYRKFGIKGKWKTGNRNDIHCYIHSVQLKELFEKLCGKGACYKKMASELIEGLPLSVLATVVKSWVKGDGYIRRHSKTIQTSASSCSLVLTHQMKDILLRLGYVPHLRYIAESTFSHITNGYRTKPYYILTWYEKGNRTFAKVDENYAYIRVTAIKRIPYPNGTIYNLTIEDDASYNLEYVTTHNTYIRVRRDAYGSCHPDERLIFYNGDSLQLDKIQEYVSKLQNDNTHQIEYINESTKLIKHNFLLPTITKDNKAEIKRGPYLIEHHYRGDMYKIYTRGGRMVNVTGNHSIYLWQPKNPHRNIKDGMQILKEARNIKVGDYVVIGRSLPILKEQPLEAINIANTFVNNLSVDELNTIKVIDDSIPQIIEKYRNNILNYLKEKGLSQEDALATLSHYKADKTLFLNIIKSCNINEALNAKYISANKSSKAIINKITDINDLLYAMGMFLAEGNLGQSDKGAYIQWSGDSVHKLIPFIKLLGLSYSYKIRQTRIKHSKINYKQCPILIISNKVFYELFNILFEKNSKQIPKFVFSLPKEQLKYFIAGMWQGDGWHTQTAKYFEYYTKDKRLAEDLILLLARFNIFANLITRKSIRDKTEYISYTVQATLNKVNPLLWDNNLKQKLNQATIGDIVLSRVTKIEKYEYDGPVYDFEVDETHAFLNNNMIKLSNTILGFVQYYMFPLVSFLASEMLHLRYMPSSWAYECYTPDTLVNANGIYQKISSIKEGNQILMHTGKVGTVEKVKSFYYKGKMIKVYPLGDDVPLVSTPTHPYYVISTNINKDKTQLNATFVLAENLQKGDLLLVPIDREEKDISHIGVSDYIDLTNLSKSNNRIRTRIEVDDKFLKFIGLYLGDGYHTQDGIVIAFNGKKERQKAEETIQLIKDVFGLHSRLYVPKPNKNVLLVICKSRFLSRLLDALLERKGAKDKYIPQIFMKLPVHKQIHLLHGLYESDGYFNKHQSTKVFTTSSETLAYQISYLLLRQNIISRVSRRYFKPTTFKDGHKTKGSIIYHITISPKSKSKIIGDYLYRPIRKIETIDYDGDIWNLDIDKDETFTVGLGYAVHNSVYGVSMLRPILFHQELIKEYEHIVGQIMNVYLKPMFIVKVGNPTVPGADNVTAEQFRDIVRAFATRQPGTDIIIRHGSLISDVQAIQAPVQAVQSSAFWLEWLHNMRSYALTVPKFMIDPAGLNRACYVEDTYVLTENGWKLHNEIKDNEKIAVYEPKNGKIWLERPIKLYSYNYEGEIIHFKDKNTDIAVTPEHKIIYKKNLDGSWLVGQAKDIIGSRIIVPNAVEWQGREEKWAFIPSIELKNGFRTEYKDEIKVKMDDFLSFIGIYLSEGGMDTKNNYIFTIAQAKRKTEKVAKIRSILSSLPFKYVEYEDESCVRWNVNGKQLCSFIASNFGNRCFNKHIPSEYKNLSKRQLKILFDSMMLGDGSIDKKGSMTYYTTSEQLAKDFLEIAIKLGYSANITYYDDKRGNRNRVYRVFVSKRQLKYIPKQRIVKEQYKGKVYCFSTTTGFYVTMRNGKVAYQGNTAQVVQEAYFTFITSLRQSITSQLEQELFPAILYSIYGEMANELIKQFGVPKIIWKPVREESMTDKVPMVIDLLRANVIEQNEARTMLGFKPLEKKTTPTERLSVGGPHIRPSSAQQTSEAPSDEKVGEELGEKIGQQLESEYLSDLSETGGVGSVGGGDVIKSAPPPAGGKPLIEESKTEEKKIRQSLADAEDLADELRKQLHRKRRTRHIQKE